ncbi:MAG: hypothetical protein ACRD2Y_05895 [Terriglobales bacterium]
MPKKSKETARDRVRQARERERSAADRAQKAKRAGFSQAAVRMVKPATDGK